MSLVYAITEVTNIKGDVCARGGDTVAETSLDYYSNAIVDSLIKH
jgi:hypothetical protein